MYLLHFAVCDKMLVDAPTCYSARKVPAHTLTHMRIDGERERERERETVTFIEGGGLWYLNYR